MLTYPNKNKPQPPNEVSATWRKLAIVLPVIATLVAPPVHDYIRQKYGLSESEHPITTFITFIIGNNNANNVEKPDNQPSFGKEEGYTAEPRDKDTPTNNNNQPNTATNLKPDNNSEQSLSQEQASALINNWLQAKNDIFAAPFSKQMLSENVFVGSTLYNDIHDSMTEIEESGSYYSFKKAEILEVVSFSSTEQTAEIKVRIYEDGVLRDKDGKIVEKYSDIVKAKNDYQFEKQDGKWKISEFQSVEEL